MGVRATSWRVGATLGAVLALVAGLAGCGRLAPATAEPVAQERMPAPAEIRLTTDPSELSIPVLVELIGGDDSAVLRRHTFEAGTMGVGQMPTSNGRYTLQALGGACAISILVGPEREADIELRVTDERTCELAQIGDHAYGAVRHADPGVLIAPGSLP